jgi:hypothetical protein
MKASGLFTPQRLHLGCLILGDLVNWLAMPIKEESWAFAPLTVFQDAISAVS